MEKFDLVQIARQIQSHIMQARLMLTVAEGDPNGRGSDQYDDNAKRARMRLAELRDALLHIENAYGG